MDDQDQSPRLTEGLERGKEIEIFVDGQPVKAYRGETIATALLASGHLVSHITDAGPLGVFCNVGMCHSCVMTVNGWPSVRICSTLVTPGCKIETQNARHVRNDV